MALASGVGSFGELIIFAADERKTLKKSADLMR